MTILDMLMISLLGKTPTVNHEASSFDRVEFRYGCINPEHILQAKLRSIREPKGRIHRV